ncbi:hypothetical protein [Thermococcus sp.]
MKPDKEAWICNFITDVDRGELKKFLKDVEWDRRIPEIAKKSAFDDYVMEKRRALMKLILKKHAVNMNTKKSSN